MWQRSVMKLSLKAYSFHESRKFSSNMDFPERREEKGIRTESRLGCFVIQNLWEDRSTSLSSGRNCCCCCCLFPKIRVMKDTGTLSGVKEQVQELYGGLGTMEPYLELPTTNCHLMTVCKSS